MEIILISKRVLLFGFLLASNCALAQFEYVQVSRVLDNSDYEFSTQFFRENTSDFRRGGSSIELIAPPSGFSSPELVIFASGDKTMTFDYKFSQNNFDDTLEVAVFSQSEGPLAVTALASTADEWCRESIYFPPGAESTNIISNKSREIDGTVLLDNFRITDGRNILPRKCFPNREPSAGDIIPVLSLLLDGPPTTRSPGSLSGRLSLPFGQVAPAGGVTFDVSTFFADFAFVDGQFLSTFDEVTIPEGQNSAAYEIDLFDEDPIVEERRLDFECIRGCEGLDITTSGLWSESTGVSGFFRATTYSHFADNVVDITLESADTFTGTVFLPVGQVATSAEFIPVRVSEEGVFLGASYSTFIRTMPGENGWTFQLGVPTDSAASNWSVEVVCLSCEPTISTEVQYATTINGDPLSEVEANRFLFAPNVDHSGVDMTFLEVP